MQARQIPQKKSASMDATQLSYISLQRTVLSGGMDCFEAVCSTKPSSFLVEINNNPLKPQQFDSVSSVGIMGHEHLLKCVLCNL